MGQGQGPGGNAAQRAESAEAAFAEIDRLRAEMGPDWAPSDAVELIVVEEGGRIVPRPAAQ